MLTAQLIALALVLGAAYIFVIEPRRLRLRRLSVPVRGLVKPTRILFASDFHANVGQAERLKKLIGRLPESERPDLLILGGDILHKGLGLTAARKILVTLRSLQLPTFAVLGNHDIMSGQTAEIRLGELFIENGFQLIQNADVLFEVPGRNQSLQLVGPDDLERDPDYLDRRNLLQPTRYKALASQMPLLVNIAGSDWPRILVSHNPDGVYLPMPGREPSLVLSGHTHGGQVFWLSWLHGSWKWLVNAFLPAGSFECFAGYRLIGQIPILVSRGVGGRSIRCGRTPEAHLIELRPVA